MKIAAKNIVLLLACGLFFFAGKASAQTPDTLEVAKTYAGGSGTKADPYQIENGQQLQKLAREVRNGTHATRGKYYVVTSDFYVNKDLLTTETDVHLYAQQTNKVINNPIGLVVDIDSKDYKAFEGVFDGQGHTISGLYVAAWASYQSLFACIENATVKNLNVTDSYICGGAFSAGIASQVINSRIINCSFTGSVRSWGSHCGGIASTLYGYSRVQNCWANAYHSTKNDAGGIVESTKAGDNVDKRGSLIENCYFFGSLLLEGGTVQSKGIIVNKPASSAIVRNCFYSSRMKPGIADSTCTIINVHTFKNSQLKSQAFADTLNLYAADIPGACRFKQGDPIATFDFSTFTDDEEETSINDQATDPSPANADLHAPCEDKKVVLTWKLPANGNPSKIYLHFGKNLNTINAEAPTENAKAVLGADTTYVVQTDSYTDKYYWRLDCEMDHKVYKGQVWCFQPRHLAFPDAEGYGRFAQGGRGGKVVYVTNLNDSGEGSFREAMTNGSGPRTIMFKVSGLICLENSKDIISDDNVTIAGQTAPGKGICFRGASVAVSNDGICRFIRSRRGGPTERGGQPDTGGSLGFHYSDHAIIDHCTASWGTDETFSSRATGNVTFQRSIISEALGIAHHRNYPEGSNHGFAATIGGEAGTYSHNLLSDCAGRNWSMGGGTDGSGAYAGQLDIFNNVCYNWGRRTTDGGARQVNFVNNYYKMGPASTITCLFSLDIEGELKGTQQAYVNGNIRDNMDGTLTTDKLNDTYRTTTASSRVSPVTWQLFVDKPFFPSYAKIESAKDAYKSVLSDVGANLPQVDNTDARIVSEVLNRSYTYTGSLSGIKGQIDNEADAGGYEAYPEIAYADDFDSDGDGLPDWWENIHGSNPNSPAGDFSDANAEGEDDGYTALEEYIEFMAHPHVSLKNADASVNLRNLFKGYTNAPVFTVAGGDNVVNTSIKNDSILIIHNISPIDAVTSLKIEVSDGEQASYSRLLNVAITPVEISGIKQAELLHEAVKTFDVYTLNGVKVLSGKGNGVANYQNLNLSSLSSGIYVVRMRMTDGQTLTMKIAK